MGDSTKSVYVFDIDNDTVKIGISNNVERRKKQIISDSGLNIRNVFHTDMLPAERAFHIEQSAHQTFNDRRTRAEFFKITFDEAVSEINRLLDFTAAHPETVPHLITSDEVAQILGVNRRTINRWRKDGTFRDDYSDHATRSLYREDRVHEFKDKMAAEREFTPLPYNFTPNKSGCNIPIKNTMVAEREGTPLPYKGTPTKAAAISRNGIPQTKSLKLSASAKSRLLFGGRKVCSRRILRKKASTTTAPSASNSSSPFITRAGSTKLTIARLLSPIPTQQNSTKIFPNKGGFM